MPETIPKFPNFRLFTIDDIKWYYNYYLAKKLNPYVDIHPENLFIWLNMNNDLMVSKLDDAIVLRYTNILDNNHTNIIPLENPLKNSTVDKIMSYLKENNLSLELHEIPSIICDSLDQNKWLIEDDRNNYEYILDTNQQSLLEGSCFRASRKRISIFKRDHINDVVDVKYFKEFNDEIVEAFIYHINNMPLNKSPKASQNNTTEPIALLKNLKYASIFHKKAIIISINGKIAALGMLSYLDKKTAAFNHLKVNYKEREIFQYTIYQLSKILKKDNITEMNIEQDLGLQDLREYKKHLNPSRFLEKKIIRPRPQ